MKLRLEIRRPEELKVFNSLRLLSVVVTAEVLEEVLTEILAEILEVEVSLVVYCLGSSIS